jgi:hypothetical protein
MRAIWLSIFAATIAVSGCLSAPPVSEGMGGSSAGTAGTGGSTGTGGSATGTGGATTGTGGATTGTGGATIGTGGATTGTGGATTGTGGATMGTGGVTTGTGGVPMGTGGRSATGGANGTGGAVGTGGATNLIALASAMDGLRVDDVCGTLQGGQVCLHVTNNDTLPYSQMKAATMGGTAGTVYQVKLHMRGVVENTHVAGGLVGTPATFVSGGTPGAVGTNDASYQQWRITVGNPSQHYYLNIIPTATTLTHVVRLLDYQETIPIAGGSSVTLDVFDGNGHLISNTASPALAPVGVPGSMNSGQFVQLNVDGVTM